MTLDGEMTENLRQADFVTHPGDSGAPVFTGTQALGIVIGGAEGSGTRPDRSEYEFRESPSWYHEIESAQHAVGGYTVLTGPPR